MHPNTWSLIFSILSLSFMNVNKVFLVGYKSFSLDWSDGCRFGVAVSCLKLLLETARVICTSKTIFWCYRAVT